MQLNEIHNEGEHASVSLKVILLVFAVILVGTLSYLVWNEQITVIDNGSTIVIKKSTTKIVDKDVVTKETGELTAVDESTSTGTFTRDFDKTKGVFTFTIEATLTDPTADKFYEGWLVRGKTGDADFKAISTGKLVKGEDDKWTVTFTSPVDYYGFENVVVTSETLENGLDGVSETHILEGAFEAKKK